MVPEQDLCQMPQVRRPGNEGDQDRMQICEEHGGSGGESESLITADFRNCNSLAVQHV